MEIEHGHTLRGFRIVRFSDRYGAACSLQQSSLATESAIWFGPDEPEPQIMASAAVAIGRADLVPDPKNPVGWVPFPIPREVMCTTRMHLTQEQVRALLPLLQHFAETGELPAET